MNAAPLNAELSNPTIPGPSDNFSANYEAFVNPNEVDNQQLTQMRGNPQTQMMHPNQQMPQMNLPPIPPSMQQMPPIPPSMQQMPQQMPQYPQQMPQQMPHPSMQSPGQFPTNHPGMSQDQQYRISQANQMTNQTYSQHMNRINSMNDKIMGHHMSNMSSLGDQPLPPPPTGEHVSFYNGGLLDSDQNRTPHQMKPPVQYNPRHCLCQPGQSYCSGCQVCGMPGHDRPYPGPVNSRGKWCDPHYQREVRMAMKKYPEAFVGYQTYDHTNPSQKRHVNPAKASGTRMTSPLRGAATPNGVPQPGNAHLQGREAQARPTTSHQRSPYELNQHNMENFKGNNPFALSRTTVRPDMLKPRENLNYAGFNAQGEKVHNKDYYRMSPGRSNEFDYYREYKKLNNSDFVASNEDQSSSNYRPYQSGIPPKRMKLNRDNLHKSRA